MMDLSEMTLANLRTLQDGVITALRAREREEVSKARDEIAEIAKRAGLSIADIMATAKKDRKSSGPVAPLYQSKNAGDKPWSGRGRQPGWIKQWVESGKSLDDLKIHP
jgi:DNA-binding protein H-NS